MLENVSKTKAWFDCLVKSINLGERKYNANFHIDLCLCVYATSEEVVKPKAEPKAEPNEMVKWRKKTELERVCRKR